MYIYIVKYIYSQIYIQSYIYIVKTSLKTLNGPFQKVVSIGSQNIIAIVQAIGWDPNKANDIGEGRSVEVFSQRGFTVYIYEELFSKT